MTKLTSILLIFLFIMIPFLIAQNNYPFIENNQDNDILAYWYNVREDSIKLNYFKSTFYFGSSLQIYGKVPGSSFTVKAEVYLKDGTKAFEKTFNVARDQKAESFTVEYSDGFFRLICLTKSLKENPSMIMVTLQTDKLKRKKEVYCRYYRLYGNVTDFEGKPFKGSIAVCPESFLSLKGIGIKCNASGEYEIELPERTYNAIVCFDEMYAIKNLEVWAWHIIMDSDQKLDFKVGTGEVYNLNIWTTNGSYNTYYVSFRPMILSLTNIKEKEYPQYPVTLNKNQFQVTDDSPPLEPEDIKVKVNGKEAKIISVQKFYQTDELDKPAHVVYVAQISREGLSRTGKQTIMVEFEKEMETGGKKILRNSMGYYQFYLNFKGLSTFY